MGLTADIFTTPLYVKSNCSNGGISSRFHEVAVMNPPLAKLPFEPHETRPAVLLKPGAYAGIIIAVPAVFDAELELWVPEKRNGVSPMFGGAYIGSSDARFTDAIEHILRCSPCGSTVRFYGAVALHDRFEGA